jgi:hypothetical protein
MKKKEGIHEINKGKICKHPGCTYHATVKGYCSNHAQILYKGRKGKMIKTAEKEIARMREHLKTKPDAALITGYNNAMDDYKKTNNMKIKLAADIIREEIISRGLTT